MMANEQRREKWAKRGGWSLCLICAAAIAYCAEPDTFWLPLTGAGHGGWALDQSLTGADNAKTAPPRYLRPVPGAPAALSVEPGTDGKGELVARTPKSKPIGIVRSINEDHDAWGQGRVFCARFLTPDDPDLRPSAQLVVYHSLYGWFATEPTRPLTPGQWTTVYWNLGDEGTDWISMSYGLAWHSNMRYELERVGLRIFLNTAADDKTGNPSNDDDDATDPKDKDDAGKDKDAANDKLLEVRIAGIGIEGMNAPRPLLEVVRLRWPSDGAVNGGPGSIPSGDHPSTVSCCVGQQFELSFDLTRSYDNPYDPDCVAVDVEFTAPSGRILEMPAFYYQDFTRRKLEDGTEVYDPFGRACWKARFLPTEPGEHTFRIAA
ncbi:MAG: DUF5060 domain-containing protein, partial [Candidatus Sumerlaeota bacterium]|nr:DUF5060 domain-containing protein [Candidatus Sumerlaeota bacterium]